MKRLTEAWFEFGGIRSDSLGIKLQSMPIRQQAALRGNGFKVTGASGTLFLSDGSYDDITVGIDFIVDGDTPSQLRSVNAWLRGMGLLRISDEPDIAYDARIVTAPRRKPLFARLSAQVYSVTFTCHPFARIWPEPAQISIISSGYSLNNPGTAPASPRVKIAGSGNFSLSVGAETIFFEGVSGGGIIVDSELMDAFTYDGALLANNKIDGTPYLIKPGRNTVSWNTYDGGTVASVTIWPRWRCL